MRFLIILITMQLCIGDVYAIGANGDCSAEDAVCDPKFWCQPIPEGQPGAGGKTCQPCTNGPTDKEGKKCGETDAACQYTGNGGNSNNCPWKMTCSVGYVWNQSQNKCEQCDDHYTSKSVIVTYDGTGYDTMPATLPVCEGEVYEIQFNTGTLDQEKIKESPIPPAIYEKYGTGFSLSQTASPIMVVPPFITPLIGTNEFLGYYTEATGGVQIFKANGEATDTLTNTYFTQDTILYAHWGDAKKYRIVLTVGTSYVAIDKQNHCIQGETSCVLDVSELTCGAGFYLKNNTTTQVSCNDITNCGEVRRTGDTVTYRPNTTALHYIIENETITVNIGSLSDACPVGSYCPACDNIPCPLSSTTDGTGKTKVSDCFWTANTVFKDSSGKTFTLPVEEGTHIQLRVTN